MNDMTKPRVGGSLVQADVLDVACPRCEEPAGADCTDPFYGMRFVTDPHDERQDRADVTMVCPACAGENLSEKSGTWTGLEYTADSCDDCGWVGDPE